MALLDGGDRVAQGEDTQVGGEVVQGAAWEDREREPALCRDQCGGVDGAVPADDAQRTDVSAGLHVGRGLFEQSPQILILFADPQVHSGQLGA